MFELITEVEADGTWLCHHVDATGAPTFPTTLRVIDTHEWRDNFRRWLNCPDCGTRWRVWTQLHQAKPSVDFPGRDRESGFDRYRHAPINDVHRVIALVWHADPRISVKQFENAWPVDDEGLWFFYVAGERRSRVQIESSFGCCPFIVEGAQCRTGYVVDEVVRYVLDELNTRKASV
jgi:hypothetical protein